MEQVTRTKQRFLGGLTNVAENSPLAVFDLPVPIDWHVYFNDFHQESFADTGRWTVTTTEAGSGNASEVVTDADSGWALFTNDNADNDRDQITSLAEAWKPISGKPMLMEVSMQIGKEATGTAGQEVWLVGLVKNQTGQNLFNDTGDLWAGDAGIGFRSADGSTNIDCFVRNADVETALMGASTFTDATTMKLTWYYDGASTVKFYKDGLLIASLASTNLPTEELCLCFFLENGEAKIHTMSVDYVLIARMR